MIYLNSPYLLFCKCLTIIVITFAGLEVNGELQSPCPNVFEYRYDSRNNLCGFIEVSNPNNYNNIIRLDVQLSVGNSVEGFNGNIALANSRSRVIEDLLQNRPIQYRIDFPYWIKVPPRITRISVNGNQICFGYPIDKRLVPVLTTINLQHTLTIASPEGPSRVNNVAPLPDLSFGGEVGTRDTAYPPTSNSKPLGPSVLNSQLPQDPSKVYSSNPFLNPNKFVPQTTTFYQNQNPNSQSGFDFPSNFQNHFHNDLGGFHPYFYKAESPYKPALDNQPFFPNRDQNAATNPSVPNEFEPAKNPQSDVTLRPQNPVIETHFLPTRSPIDSDADDLPTVESNLVKKPFSGVCGISINANELLVNGNRVAKNAHPWLAALFKQNDESLKFICGSTLISKKHVVTAAHCVRSRLKKLRAEELWVVLGRENIQRWSNDGAQIVQAESTYIHPDYKFNTADADISVIVLTEEAVFSNLIRPACLWTGDKNPKLIVEKKGSVAGWGKDQSGKISTRAPTQLSFPVVSEENCLRSNPGFREITSNRTFCAGYRNNSGPCNGDSGGGFLMQRNGRWTLRGVVSMSLLGPDGKCDLQHYVVLTDAAQFTDWLLSFLV